MKIKETVGNFFNQLKAEAKASWTEYQEDKAAEKAARAEAKAAIAISRRDIIGEICEYLTDGFSEYFSDLFAPFSLRYWREHKGFLVAEVIAVVMVLFLGLGVGGMRSYAAAPPEYYKDIHHMHVIGDDLDNTKEEETPWYSYYAFLFNNADVTVDRLGTREIPDSEIIVLMLGKDAMTGRVPVDQYQKGLEQTLERIKEDNPEALVLYALGIICGKGNQWRPYDKAAKETCDELNVVYAPVWSADGKFDQADVAEELGIYTAANLP